MTTTYNAVSGNQSPGMIQQINLKNDTSLNGWRLMHCGEGAWIENWGGGAKLDADNTVNVCLRRTNAKTHKYAGIITGAFGDCVMVGLFYKQGNKSKYDSISLAHVFGGDSDHLDQHTMVAGMVPDTVRAVVATDGESDSFGVTNCTEKIMEWGIKSSNITVYTTYSPSGIKRGTGFGVGVDGGFGEVEENKPISLKSKSSFFFGIFSKATPPNRIAKVDEVIFD
ncbi:MAG: hypothetical protein JRI43_00930 [Deltaproteobacteria bacterium]|nr:hypothetical protein [Deltaproteobacteria bacterium]